MCGNSLDYETRLVADFFGDTRGYFVEVGANEPRFQSQTWHLEQSGWTGVLIEPQPDLARELQKERQAKVFAVACSAPENDGGKLPLYVHGALSTLDRHSMAPGNTHNAVIDVPIRTLDGVLAEAGAPGAFDFLSIDVEGHEIEVLRGFDAGRWRPRLIMIEDFVRDLSTHDYMRSIGYRIVRRYENNGWYVPVESPAQMLAGDRWEVVRKYYLALPIRKMRNLSRRLRGK